MSMPDERITTKNDIMDICNKDARWAMLDESVKQAHVRKIERSCYNNAVNSCVIDGHVRSFKSAIFLSRYSINCYKIKANLDIHSSVGSHYLMDNILDGVINLDNISEYTSPELCPEASQKERDEIMLRKQQKVEKKVSRQYKCSKCGKNETTLIEYMGRSADEAMKLSIACNNCPNVWRI